MHHRKLWTFCNFTSLQWRPFGQYHITNQSVRLFIYFFSNRSRDNCWPNAKAVTFHFNPEFVHLIFIFFLHARWQHVGQTSISYRNWVGIRHWLPSARGWILNAMLWQWMTVQPDVVTVLSQQWEYKKRLWVYVMCFDIINMHTSYIYIQISI